MSVTPVAQTPVVIDSSAAGTAGEFVWKTVKFPGSVITSIAFSAGQTDLRAIAINTTLNNNAVEIHDSTGRKLIIPAASVQTLQPIYYGDGMLDGIMLVFPSATTGEISLLVKVF